MRQLQFHFRSVVNHADLERFLLYSGGVGNIAETDILSQTVAFRWRHCDRSKNLIKVKAADQWWNTFK